MIQPPTVPDLADNPYRSPDSLSTQPTPPVSPARRQASRSWQVAMLMLFLPAINNYLLYETMVFEQGLVNGESTLLVMRLVNGLAISAAFLISGLAGVWILERVTQWLNRRLGRPETQGAWLEALYGALRQSVWLAIAGVLIWKAWLYGFYSLKLDFYVVSVPAAIAGHLVAAALYLPLAVKWYRIEHRSTD